MNDNEEANKVSTDAFMTGMIMFAVDAAIIVVVSPLWVPALIINRFMKAIKK